MYFSLLHPVSRHPRSDVQRWGSCRASRLTGRSITTTTTRSTCVFQLRVAPPAPGAGYASDGTGNPAGTEGWSARGGWSAPAVEGESAHRRVVINGYIYDSKHKRRGGISYHFNTYTDDLQWLEGRPLVLPRTAHQAQHAIRGWHCRQQRRDFFNRGLMGGLLCDKQNVKWRAAYKYPTSLTTTGRDSPDSQHLV